MESSFICIPLLHILHIMKQRWVTIKAMLLLLVITMVATNIPKLKWWIQKETFIGHLLKVTLSITSKDEMKILLIIFMFLAFLRMQVRLHLILFIYLAAIAIHMVERWQL